MTPYQLLIEGQVLSRTLEGAIVSLTLLVVGVILRSGMRCRCKCRSARRVLYVDLENPPGPINGGTRVKDLVSTE